MASSSSSAAAAASTRCCGVTRNDDECGAACGAPVDPEVDFYCAICRAHCCEKCLWRQEDFALNPNRVLCVRHRMPEDGIHALEGERLSRGGG